MVLQFPFWWERYCNLLFGLKDVAIFFLATEVLQFYSWMLQFSFWQQKCCNLILGNWSIIIWFLVTEVQLKVCECILILSQSTSKFFIVKKNIGLICWKFYLSVKKLDETIIPQRHNSYFHCKLTWWHGINPSIPPPTINSRIDCSLLPWYGKQSRRRKTFSCTLH